MTLPADPINEERLANLARRLDYPAAPDVSRCVRLRIEAPRGRSRAFAWRAAALVIAALLVAALSVPQVRAALVGFFRVGVVRILPTAPVSATAPSTALPMLTPVPNLPAALRGLEGRTTLEQLSGRALIPIQLPTYPADLGAPDFVFDQGNVPMYVFAWRDPNDPERLRLSLYEIAPGSLVATKFEPRIVQETTVNGRYALWVAGDYLIQLTNGNFDLRRIVEGFTLVWEQDGITYRLETDLPLDEARKIAESLR